MTGKLQTVDGPSARRARRMHQAAELTHWEHNALAHQRFAARKTNPADAARDEGGTQPVQRLQLDLRSQA